MKKVWKFLSSMPFAVGLLILLAVFCAISSGIPQGQAYETYAARYGERTAGLILALRLDDAFHSWWFVALSGVLCLNLLCCNLIRLPSLLRRSRSFGNSESFPSADAGMEAWGQAQPEAVFQALSMPEPRAASGDEGRRVLFSVRNRAGLWGPWVCHLGILLLILGFALGQMTTEQYTLYALPGQTKEMGETGLWITVSDFRADLREDGSAEQFTASLTAADPSTGRLEEGEASVNAPASLFGYSFFQNSYGWGADIRVTKDGQPLQTEAVCAGDFLTVMDKPELVIWFQAFYPDYVMTESAGPSTASALPDNPAYLYRVYYQNRMLGMNVLMADEELTIDEYTVVFENPRQYTLLAVKRDRFTGLVLLGGLITLCGLVLAFYLQPAALRADEREDGTWRLRAACRKGGVLFREDFERAAREAGFRIGKQDGAEKEPGAEKREEMDEA